jgi:hypothetical protein
MADICKFRLNEVLKNAWTSTENSRLVLSINEFHVIKHYYHRNITSDLHLQD